MEKPILNIGIDVGSTTVKVVVINDKEEILFSTYQRHMSEVRQKIISILQEVQNKFPNYSFRLALTGSGALTLYTKLNLNFVQEVIASGLSIKSKIPQADVIVELGGEDAKLTFLTNGTDLRMNETCAGGTGAFIDQMASFLNIEVPQMDALALEAKNVYPIASRCGVFAKTDIVPLINEGCTKSDISLSIMQAVVNQFIGGLARGRKIEGNVVFLGGPLSFLKSLKNCFVKTLNLNPEQAIFPQKAEIFVAIGAALYALRHTEQEYSLAKIIDSLKDLKTDQDIQKLPPLFKNETEYQDFIKRHQKNDVKTFPLEEYEGPAYLGIDSGSTTIKAVLIDEQNRVLYSSYGSNNGDPFAIAIKILQEIYSRQKPGLKIKAAAATGYGSALLKAGLKFDIDEVETVAHATAATFFAPKATFVLDIGGQDIKCMSLKNGAIDHIGLNEACSAGCGSFIENFAKSLDMELEQFVLAALKAKNPVDLGTRCTVFMNSKVKQAQKEGVPVGDIAAGLSYSVIKNACYKVIKIRNVEELGDTIVAQGGSFLNNALLRALELQVGKKIIRPSLSGLMGAFGAALIAKKRGPENNKKTALLSKEEIDNLKITTRNVRCQGCTNHCMLTISNFGGKENFISGNRCERGAGLPKNKHINLADYKYNRLFNYYKPLPAKEAKNGTIGIPRALDMFETYPLWFTLLTELGFKVELSEASSKKLFFEGYSSIPSQTICYPAKMAHGHIMNLLSKKVDAIFFPSIILQKKDFSTQEDSYNCPIVAGYPELLYKNITEIAEQNIPYYAPFLPLDEKVLAKRLKKVSLFKNFSKLQLSKAVKKAFAEQRKYLKDIRETGRKAVEELTAQGKLGIVLSAHPYHIDPAINHGIPELINSCGLAVLTEDSVAHLQPDPGPLKVRDQWTYHARLYRAAAFVAKQDNLSVLQLVSFGCGL
ncbi:MAG: 2-hydroxyglutaryl-CoA dehydratase, partial [Elusimicrobiaceae bacterium]|nr:2-hydroxyglutaryl-CoA dehydratase [Elusimicrobiaceae bacterium]